MSTTTSAPSTEQAGGARPVLGRPGGVTEVFEAMGTVASLRSVEALPEGALAACRAVFDALEDRFSLYREESELSRVNRRGVLMPRASEELRATWRLAEEWRVATDGAFTPNRPDGRLDLDGVVKAIAIRDGVAALKAHGAHDFCLNVGGDVLVDGTDRTADGTPVAWVAGIVDPADRGALLSQATLSDELPAVCTSGVSERGEHIWRVQSDDTFAQVTVVGPDVVTADVLATAIVAGGPGSLHLAEEHGCEVLAVGFDGTVRASAAFLA